MWVLLLFSSADIQLYYNIKQRKVGNLHPSHAKTNFLAFFVFKIIETIDDSLSVDQLIY